MPVQRGTGPVIPHRGARVGVGSCFLHVAECDPGIQRGGDERVPERVGTDGLSDPSMPGEAADDPPGAVPIQPSAIRSCENGPRATFADGQVDRAGGARGEWDGDDLAALAGDHQDPVPAFQAQRLDVGPCGLGDAQAVQSQQRDQCVFGGRAEPGRDEQRAELVTV
jgi:hypothetical protein